jgi:hypothetical protein
MVLNKNLQVCIAHGLTTRSVLKLYKEINIQNMNVELVAQMFKNYRSNVLFHLEGESSRLEFASTSLQVYRNGRPYGTMMKRL